MTDLRVEDALETAIRACKTPAEIGELLTDVIGQLRRPVGGTRDLRVVAAVCKVHDVNVSFSNGVWQFSTPRLLSQRGFERLHVEVDRAIKTAEAALAAGRDLQDVSP